MSCKGLVKSQKCKFSLWAEAVLWEQGVAVRNNFPSHFHTKQEVVAHTVHCALVPFQSSFFLHLRESGVFLSDL